MNGWTDWKVLCCGNLIMQPDHLGHRGAVGRAWSEAEYRINAGRLAAI